MSQFSRRIICALTTAVFATMLTAGATATAVEGGQQLEDPKYYEIPTVGECRYYGMAAANAATNSHAVVPCGDLHTAKVIATPLLPEGMTWDSSAEAIHLVMVKACLPAFRSILGRTERLRQKSAYEIVWFVPTQTQKDNGARWLRCDLVLSGGSTLMPIRRNTAPILQAAPLPKAVTSCLVGEEAKKTVCTKTHRFRATGTWLVERTYFPGNAVMFDIAKRRCPSLVSTPRHWYAYWMDRNAWKAGDRTITCYTHTSN